MSTNTIADSFIEEIALTCGGNPGSLSVVQKGITDIGFEFYQRIKMISCLRDASIWLFFKDHCNMDINKMYEELAYIVGPINDN